jgi:hypothetical protein
MAPALARATLLELAREAPAVREQAPDDVVAEITAIELDEIHAEGLVLDRRLDDVERITRRR